VRQWLAFAVETQQSWNVYDQVTRLALLGLPRHASTQMVEQLIDPAA
jgi:hypothetical protein